MDICLKRNKIGILLRFIGHLVPGGKIVTVLYFAYNDIKFKISFFTIILIWKELE